MVLLDFQKHSYLAAVLVAIFVQMVAEVVAALHVAVVAEAAAAFDFLVVYLNWHCLD